MQQTRYGLIVSATDLADHLRCDHLTTSEVASATGHMSRPERVDIRSAELALQGLRHETRYVELLKEAGNKITIIDGDAADNRHASRRALQTRQAMQRGEDFIYQATFLQPSPTGLFANKPILWVGHADMIRRVPGTSDTKFST